MGSNVECVTFCTCLQLVKLISAPATEIHTFSHTQISNNDRAQSSHIYCWSPHLYTKVQSKCYECKIKTRQSIRGLASLSSEHRHFLEMMSHHLIQHLAHAFTGRHGRFDQRLQVVLMQSGVHLKQSYLSTPGKQRQGQRAQPSTFLCVAKVGEGRLVHEPDRAGAHVVPHGDACVDHSQGGGVHTHAVVPSIWLQNLFEKKSFHWIK